MYICVCLCACACFFPVLSPPSLIYVYPLRAQKKIVINDTTTGATATATATTAGYKLDQTRRWAQTKIITEKIQYIYMCVFIIYLYYEKKREKTFSAKFNLRLYARARAATQSTFVLLRRVFVIIKQPTARWYYIPLCRPPLSPPPDTNKNFCMFHWNLRPMPSQFVWCGAVIRVCACQHNNEKFSSATVWQGEIIRNILHVCASTCREDSVGRHNCVCFIRRNNINNSNNIITLSVVRRYIYDRCTA